MCTFKMGIDIIEQERRAKAQEAIDDALEAEFDQAYSENDIIEDYEKEFNVKLSPEDLEKEDIQDDLEEHKQWMFETYCEDRKADW